MVPRLSVEGLRAGYRGTDVLHEVTLPSTAAGQVTALIGPNAAGKSTLLRGIAGIQRARGRVRIERDGRPDPDPPGPEEIFYLPQEPPPRSTLTVFEAILLACARGRGRAARRRAERDAGTALAQLRLDELATRPVAELSGGQRQLVGLAQAVARRPSVLLLDEPTSNLDLRNQLRILELVRRIAEDQPACVLVTVHDLNLTARFADQVVVLHRGRVHSSGPPPDVLTPEMLREVYRVQAHVHRTVDDTLTISVSRGL